MKPGGDGAGGRLPTVTDGLGATARQIGSDVAELFARHSAIRLVNEPGSGIINFSGDYGWRPLADEGRRLQSKILREYAVFVALLRTLLQQQPERDRRRLDETENRLRALIEQHAMTHHPTPATAGIEAAAALDAQLALVTGLYDAGEGAAVFVPDTNALYAAPALEKWQFADAPTFTLVLVPSVLTELDLHKAAHRDEGVRKKAQGLVRQIKEYRRRGRLTEGVPLVRGVSEVIGIATEPDMAQAPPWLVATNADDRFLASTLEVMRQRPRSAVTVVTTDVNMQNKAEYARIPSVEPPDFGS